MKLVTFDEPGFSAPRIGVILGEVQAILDLQGAHSRTAGIANPAFKSMQDLVEAGEAGLSAVRALLVDHDPKDRFPLRAEHQLLAPLPCPIQIRDCLGFEQHLINTINTVMILNDAKEHTPRQRSMLQLFRTRPFWYKANRFAVSGPDITVEWPSYSQLIDYELEMAVVIGRRGRDIRTDQARKYIFGYTIFNDLSARDVQVSEMEMFGPCKSKDFDGSNIFGPCIVTADEFDPYDAKMTTIVNGDVKNVGHSSTMHYSFEDMIACVSQGETLHAGEILCSGTVGGGSGLDIGCFLKSGDVIEVEIEGIGRIKNKIVASHTFIEQYS
jgi:2-keto-4-pentenoate hydratase/2-oxohepta-3-ene-1,7-dioic acid hydratase in catechol pathway